MTERHIDSGNLEKYLLGILSDDEARPIEERYFIDAAFFRQATAAERALIANYLDHRLGAVQAKQFRKAFGRTPALRERVEAVMRERGLTGTWRPEPFFSDARLAVAMVLVAVAVSVGIYYGQTRRNPPLVPGPRAIILAPIPIFHLTPGVTKDAASRVTRLDIPNGAQQIHITIDLPVTIGASYLDSQVRRVAETGPSPAIWSGQAVSEGADMRSWYIVLPADLLSSGDYLLDISAPGGSDRFTCVFRTDR